MQDHTVLHPLLGLRLKIAINAMSIAAVFSCVLTSRVRPGILVIPLLSGLAIGSFIVFCLENFTTIGISENQMEVWVLGRCVRTIPYSDIRFIKGHEFPIPHWTILATNKRPLSFGPPYDTVTLMKALAFRTTCVSEGDISNATSARKKYDRFALGITAFVTIFFIACDVLIFIKRMTS